MSDRDTLFPGDAHRDQGRTGDSGTWRIIKNVRSGYTEMYPDVDMLRLLGLEQSPGPAECFQFWFSRITPEDLPKAEKMAAQMETTFNFTEAEYHWRHPARGIIRIRCGGRMERLENGISCQSGYCRNITGIVQIVEESHMQCHKRAEISRQKEQYDDLFQSVLCGIVQYKLTANGSVCFVNANREAIRIFRYTPEEFWAKDDWFLPALIAEEDRERILAEVGTLQNAGDKKGFEYRIASKDGSLCWVIGTAELLYETEEERLFQSVFLDINARKSAELENLRLRREAKGINEILRMALSGTGINEFLYYPQERYALLPERLCRAYDLESRYDNLPEGFSDKMVFAPDRAVYCGIYERIDAGAAYASAEFRLREENNWLRLSMSVVQCDEQGRPEYVVGIVEDIAAQKQAESEKNQLEQLNNEVLHSLNELFFGVFRINITTGKVRAIRSHGEMDTVISMEREIEYRAEDFATVYSPADRTRYCSDMGLENLRSLYESGHTSFTREYRRQSEKGYAWIACSVYYKKSEQGIIAIMATTDITERHKMNDVVQALSDEYYAVYYLNLHTGEYETLRRDIRARGWEVPVHGNIEETVSLFLQYVAPEDREEVSAFYAGAKAEILSEEKKLSHIFREYRDSGYEWAQCILIGGREEESGHAILAFRSVDRDVRQEIETQKLLQDALERAESANRAKSDFLSRMSHDIRTPMNAIIGMTNLAKTHRTEPEKLDEDFAKISLAGNHLMALINEVLDMSKIESGSLTLENTPFDVVELVGAVVAMHQNAVSEKAQILEVRIEEVVHPRVLGDSLRIQLILNNILSNATKYTPLGGSIFMTVKELAGTPRLSTFIFIINDTGMGMTQEFQKRIFEPFVRADDSRTSRIHGTGLGMAIAHNLVRMMDGEIKVESVQGKGSRFTVELPLALQEDGAACRLRKHSSLAEPMEGEDVGGRRLLLVEDNELNMEIARALLEGIGARIETAENGREALYKVSASPEGYFDGILMDVQMPVMNGLEATKAIRALPRKDTADLPIIALTANAFAEDVKASLAAGMNAHIAKPLDFDELRRTLARWFYKR